MVKSICTIDCHVHPIPSQSFKFDIRVIDEYVEEAKSKDIHALVLSEHIHAREYLKFLQFFENPNLARSCGDEDNCLYKYKGIYFISAAEVPLVLKEGDTGFYGDSLVIDKPSRLRRLQQRQDENVEEIALMLGIESKDRAFKEGKFLLPDQVRPILSENALYGPVHLSRVKQAPYGLISKLLDSKFLDKIDEEGEKFMLNDYPVGAKLLLKYFDSGVFNIAELNGKDVRDHRALHSFFRKNKIHPLVAGSDCHTPKYIGQEISKDFRGMLGLAHIHIPCSLNLTENNFSLNIFRGLVSRDDVHPLNYTDAKQMIKDGEDIRRAFKLDPEKYGFVKWNA